MGRRKTPRPAPQPDPTLPEGATAMLTVAMVTKGGTFAKTFYFRTLRMEHRPEYVETEYSALGAIPVQRRPIPTGRLHLEFDGEVLGES